MSELFDVVTVRTPQGLGLYLKERHHGRLFRLAPARDPAQPRFWCLRVDRCTRSGAIDPAGRACLTALGMTREELLATLQAIRANASAWLAHRERQGLRRWLIDASVDHSEVEAATGHGQLSRPSTQPESVRQATAPSSRPATTALPETAAAIDAPRPAWSKQPGAAKLAVASDAYHQGIAHAQEAALSPTVAAAAPSCHNDR